MKCRLHLHPGQALARLKTVTSTAFAVVRIWRFRILNPHSSSKLKASSLTASADGASSASLRPARFASVRSISVTPRPYRTPAMEHLKNSMRLHVSVPVTQLTCDIMVVDDSETSLQHNGVPCRGSEWQCVGIMTRWAQYCKVRIMSAGDNEGWSR